MISFRKVLFALVAKAKHSLTPTKASSSSSHVNFRYLSTPEKIERLHQLSKKEGFRIGYELKLDKALEERNTSLDDDMSHDLQKVMEEEDHNIKFPEDSFQASSKSVVFDCLAIRQAISS